MIDYGLSVQPLGMALIFPQVTGELDIPPQKSPTCLIE